jgi:hypothetical protein
MDPHHRRRNAADRMPARRPWLCAAAIVALAGCGAGAQKDIISAVVADNGERAKAFEATARTLDEHPEYVDEFYRVARRHPATMHRFLSAMAPDMREPELATANAEVLAENPASLAAVLVATLDAAKSRPATRAAIDSAAASRADVLADIIADSPHTVTTVTNADIAAIGRRPAAQAAFLEAMRNSARRVADILKQDPDTTKVLVGAFVRENDPPALAQLLQKLGIVK